MISPGRSQELIYEIDRLFSDPSRPSISCAYLKTYGSISNIEAQALTNAHRNTISGDLKI